MVNCLLVQTVCARTIVIIDYYYYIIIGFCGIILNHLITAGSSGTAPLQPNIVSIVSHNKMIEYKLTW